MTYGLWRNNLIEDPENPGTFLNMFDPTAGTPVPIVDPAEDFTQANLDWIYGFANTSWTAFDGYGVSKPSTGGSTDRPSSAGPIYPRRFTPNFCSSTPAPDCPPVLPEGGLQFVVKSDGSYGSDLEYFGQVSIATATITATGEIRTYHDASTPDLFGNMISLEETYWDGNNFTGPIPSSVGALTSLTKISFAPNKASEFFEKVFLAI